MLPREHRLSRAQDFTDVVRRGRRAGRPLLTVHADLGPSDRGPSDPGHADPGHADPADPPRQSAAAPPRAGLVVGKAVGGSVVRSRTSRRLRHLLRERLPALPPGSRVVVRAAPSAGTADSAALGADLDAALTRLLRPRPGTRP